MKKMKCGHVSKYKKDGKPYCYICECDKCIEKEVKAKEYKKTIRLAVCRLCSGSVPSQEKLPHFKKETRLEHDTYYCGCYRQNLVG